MKKLLSLILATVMLFSVLCMLPSCMMGENEDYDYEKEDSADAKETSSTKQTASADTSVTKETTYTSDTVDVTDTNTPVDTPSLEGTEGLKFTLSNDGTYYSVSAGTAKSKKKIVIPTTFNGIEVCVIDENGFQNCGAEEIIIQSSITNIGDNAFSYCTRLKSISIPDSVHVIGESAFAYCSSLSSVEFGQGVTRIGEWAFRECTGLKVYIDDLESWFRIRFVGATANPLKNNHGSLYVGGKLLTNLVIPSSVTAINDDAFCGYEKLTSVKMHDNIVSIGSGAFSQTGLTTVTLPNGIKEIEDTLFGWCPNLESVSIPNSVVSIDRFAFYHCESLSNIRIPEGVKTIGVAAFEYCSSLSSVTIPKSLTKIEQQAFSVCDNLRYVYISDLDSWMNISFVDNPLQNGAYLLLNRDPVTTIEFPQGTLSVNKYVFMGCLSINSVTVSQGVIGIEGWAFCKCTRLTDITIPKSVKSIGIRAFWDCTSLNTIYYEGTKAEWQAITKGEDWNDGVDSCAIFCTDGKIVLN